MPTASFSVLVLLFFLTSFSFSAHLYLAADTISQGQSLSGGQTIVSKGGNFELGFFTPGNSSKYYVGIWYKNVSQPTVVWVANRENPVSNASSSELKLSEDGVLVLVTYSQIPVWSSNSTSPASNSTVAVLLDDGNLVLRDESTPRNILWQSFDHPTNTWLPGAKLGYDKFHGEDRFLTSWRSPEDPSPGPFSVKIDPNGVSQFYLVAYGSHPYWTTGRWDGQIFSAVPEMRSNYFFNFNYVANVNVNYFTYAVRHTSVISNFMLDFTGEMKRRQWDRETRLWVPYCSLPRDPCDVYALCGSFGSCNNYSSAPCQCLPGFEPQSAEEWSLGATTGGCVRGTPFKCQEKDGFVKLLNLQLPLNSKHLPVIRSAEDCESTCLKNCSCTAYSYHDRCLVWNGDLLNLKKLSDSPSGAGESAALYLRLEASEVARLGSSKKRTKTAAIIGIAVGVAMGACLALVCSWVCYKRLAVGNSVAAQGVLVPFDYKVIKRATKDFSEKLGQGSFGSVFKGVLPDSSAIAVKRLEGLRQGEKQFRMEVSTLGMIHHVNLVQLRGFCSEGDKKLLVYEYVPRGSLDSYLFGNSSTLVLKWDQRYQTAVGIAKGLAYLHEKCRECIIHCDIKPENVLLDSDLCPKVADFGMAKLVGHEFSRVLTTMRGTIGYLAPEWITGCAITPKADVYSYGLMLFEVISGRRNTDVVEGGRNVYFPLWAVTNVHEGDVLCLLDKRLDGQANIEELSRACRIACWCIQDQESNRPTMGQVVQQLEGIVDFGLPPVPRLLEKLFVNNWSDTVDVAYSEAT